MTAGGPRPKRPCAYQPAQSTMTVPSLSPFSTARCARAFPSRELRGDVVDTFAGRRAISRYRPAPPRAAAGQRVQHQRAQRDAFLHQFAHRKHRGAVAVGGRDGDGRIHRHQLQASVAMLPPKSTSTTRSTPRCPVKATFLGDHVLGLVIDDEIGAGLPRLLGFGVELTVAMTPAPPLSPVAPRSGRPRRRRR